ncbi:TonB family protein [Helicobacter sp. MIT 21-1697]|uniref:energy transducer TonB n=1 Tax=Helicobacter sp. MIT 21-1697 TaxID=2993733 RepID=UPI00224B130B|nr:TonB family protein [Helicobacter sp. MIT 21-1697]MCX2717662.1 TonB family protein [Helicobacter sp. MIT 21-1697]
MTYKMLTYSPSRLWLWFIVSFLIHMIIIVFLLVHFEQMQFKKGTSTDTRMKVAGFQIVGGGELESTQNTQQHSASPLEYSPTYIPKSYAPLSTSQPFDLSSLSLYDGKGKAQQTLKSKSHIKALAKFPSVDNFAQRDIEELYGAEFGDYGLAEQEFLVNHLRDIGRITQRYLQYPPSALRLGQEGLSAVEFYLHPNGDISGLKVIVSSNYMLLDRNSERTIEIAYKDYPRPISKTKIRIFVSYGISYYRY